MFVERDSTGKMSLRRGFSIAPGQNILVVEDVWTTGGSTVEAIRVMEECGGKVIAAGALVDRSSGKIKFSVRMNHSSNLKSPATRQPSARSASRAAPR